MIERICPACQHGNPLDDRFCGTCGAALERQLPIRRPESRLAVAGRQLPVTWQQLGKTVALSVATLAAEAGLAWLRRRIEVGPSAVTSAITPSASRAGSAAPETTALARVGGQVVTVVSQRVTEVWDGGEKTRQVIERTFWRRIEE